MGGEVCTVFTSGVGKLSGGRCIKRPESREWGLEDRKHDRCLPDFIAEGSMTRVVRHWGGGERAAKKTVGGDVILGENLVESATYHNRGWLDQERRTPLSENGKVTRRRVLQKSGREKVSKKTA